MSRRTRSMLMSAAATAMAASLAFGAVVATDDEESMEGMGPQEDAEQMEAGLVRARSLGS